MPTLLILVLTTLISITSQAMSQNFPTSCREGSVLIADSSENESITSCVSPHIAQKFKELGWIILDENITSKSLINAEKNAEGPGCSVERLFLRSDCFLAKFDDQLVFVIPEIPLGITPSEKLSRAAIFELRYQSTVLEESEDEDAHYLYTADPNSFFWTNGNMIIIAVGSGPIGGWKPHHLNSQ